MDGIGLPAQTNSQYRNVRKPSQLVFDPAAVRVIVFFPPYAFLDVVSGKHEPSLQKKHIHDAILLLVDFFVAI